MVGNPGAGVIVTAASVALPLLLEVTRGLLKPLYLSIVVGALGILLFWMSIGHPYLIIEPLGENSGVALATRWIACFVVVTLAIHAVFGFGKTSRNKRMICVLSSALIGFCILTGGLSMS
jgi:hypothetical protein